MQMKVMRRKNVISRLNSLLQKKNLFFTAIIIILFVTIVSCGGDIPSGILNHEKMQAVYWDIIVADKKIEEFVVKDSSKNDSLESAKLQQQIFAMHQTTKDQFYKSLDFYRTKPTLMNRLLDSMVSRSNRERYAPSNFIKPVTTDTTPQQIRPPIKNAIK